MSVGDGGWVAGVGWGERGGQKAGWSGSNERVNWQSKAANGVKLRTSLSTIFLPLPTNGSSPSHTILPPPVPLLIISMVVSCWNILLVGREYEPRPLGLVDGKLALGGVVGWGC